MLNSKKADAFVYRNTKAVIKIPGKISLGIPVVFLLICLSFGEPKAQDSSRFELSNTMLLSTSDEMPFWFVANRGGGVQPDNSALNLSQVLIDFSGGFFEENILRYHLGGTLIAGFGNENYRQVNRLFGSLGYRKWRLTGGWFQNEIVYNGLSSTNGDFHWSDNTRPLPRLRFETNGFISFPFVPRWLSVRSRYEEGWLNDDNRFVQNTRLHQKFVHFGFKLDSRSFLIVGLDHYSMWGGTHPTVGPLPSGFDDYFRYVLGLPGSDEFIKGDQNLTAGNQLGKYVVKYHRNFNTGNLKFYYNHPFTDRMDYSNYKDNLAGIFYESNDQKLLSSVLYEFMYTNHQRVRKTDDGYKIPRGYEPYFMHGIYKSGMSYQSRMLGTPFAVPLVIKDGINYGTGNNRIILHHLGMAGFLTPALQWKGMVSYSKNFGTFSRVYRVIDASIFDTPRQQINLYGELIYTFLGDKWSLMLAAAADKGELLPDSGGIQFTICYRPIKN